MSCFSAHIFTGVFLCLFTIQKSSAQSTLLAELEAIVLTNLDGDTINAKDALLESDKPVIICVWATWSAYGKRNMREINEFVIQNDLAKKFHFVTISVDDNTSSARIPEYLASKEDINQVFKHYIDLDRGFRSVIGGGPLEGNILIIDKNGTKKFKTGPYFDDEFKKQILNF